MKNLEFAIDTLQKVTVPIEFDIFGPIRDAAYWQRCEDRIANLPQRIRANYRGSVEHDDVADVLGRYDLFFLPTLGENYGHVILEALAAGTPALIADTTPWQKLTEAGVGWVLPLSDQEAFVHAIEKLHDTPKLQRERQRVAAHGYAQGLINDPAALDANERLFNMAIGA